MKRLILAVMIFLAFTNPLFGQPDIDLEELDRYIEKAVSDFELPGMAVSIVQDSSVVFSKAYGFRDMDTKEPLTRGSLFNIASCTKAFTAACLALCVEEGRLGWEDKVVDFIPHFRLADPYITSEMNMIDILSHRSGLGTFYGDLLWYESDYDNDEIIQRLRHLPIKNDFRSDFGYQNNMYLIAGEIVKAVTGISWSDFMYERLFRPLEMIETRTCSEHLAEDQDIAYPHLEGDRQDLSIYDPGPEGSVYSNISEMSNWLMMLLNGGRWKGRQILSPDLIEELFTPRTILHVSPGQKKNGTHFFTYGLGWFLLDYAGRKVVEHGGGMPGYISRVTLIPEENFGMVILTNDMNSLPRAIRMRIIDTFLEAGDTDWAKQYLDYKHKSEERAEAQKAERESKRVMGTKPSLALDHYTGIYEDKMYGPAQIVLHDDELWLRLMPTKEKFVSVMEHWHHDTFRIKFKDAFLPEGFVTFGFSTDREVTNFNIDLPNPDFHFFNLDFQKQK